MSVAFPIPRQIRRQDLVAAAGQTGFAPTDFKVYDPADVRVRVKGASGRFSTITTGFGVALSGTAPAYPIVTFAVGRVANDVIRIEGARTPSRTTDVTQAGILRAAPMETELDRVSITQQELRRDTDDALLGLDGLGLVVDLINVAVGAAAGSASSAAGSASSASGSAAAAAASAAAAGNKLDKGQNLSDLADAGTARQNIGLVDANGRLVNAVVKAAALDADLTPSDAEFATGTSTTKRPSVAQVVPALALRQVCVANNAALALLSPALSPVIRLGYAAAGDAPPTLYKYTSSTVTADGGSAVAANGGGTWVAAIDGRADVRIWGIFADSNGTTGNGTDNAPQLRKAITWAQKGARTLFFPNTLPPKVVNSFANLTFYRLASPIDNIAGSISFEGEGSESAVSTLYFDHSGRGFDITTAMPELGSIRFEKLGTFRNQPTPSATANTAWTPANNDYDIFKPGKGDLTIRDVMMFNPTNGLYVTFGRIVVDGLRGHFLKVGTYIDTVYDTVSFVNFRSWPYWQQNDNVFDYTANNCKTTVWGRVDNPNLVNFFSIFNAYSIYLINTTGDANNPSNPMSRMRISNFDVDGCGRWAIFSELPACTLQLATATVYCTNRPNVKGSGALFLSAAAKDCIVTASGFRSTKSGDAAIRVEGTGCLVQVSSFQADGYGMVDTTAPVVYCARGSIVDIQSSFNPIATKNFEHAYGTPSGAALYFGGTAYVLTTLDMLALPQASGTVLLHDKPSGSMAMYALTNGGVTPVFNTSGSLFINVNGGTTANVKSNTPSGKIGVGFATDTVAASGGNPAMPAASYRIYNNTGSTVNVYQRFQGSHPNV